MPNYPDFEERLASLKAQVLAIHERLEMVERMLRNSEKSVERAAVAQGIKDEWVRIT